MKIPAFSVSWKTRDVFVWGSWQATRAAQPPWLHLWGVAERSESFKIMIAGGNHSTVKRWLSVSETGGVCSSTEHENPSTSRSFGTSPFRGGKAAAPLREAKSLPYGCGGRCREKWVRKSPAAIAAGLFMVTRTGIEPMLPP